MNAYEFRKMISDNNDRCLKNCIMSKDELAILNPAERFAYRLYKENVELRINMCGI